MAKMMSSLTLGRSPSTPSFYRPSSSYSSSSVPAIVRFKPTSHAFAKSSCVYKNGFVCARADKKKWMIPKAGEMEGESEEIETEAETETEGESESEVEVTGSRKKAKFMIRIPKKQRLVLKFIWMEKNIGLALDQLIPGHGTVPLSPYYFWPRKDAWEELKAALESKPWISPKRTIILLNQATDIINLWQQSGSNI
ncbi:small ribosomal subunit protein cS23 [Cryptomeria japonica]|uniref:small ribosomal subunit protein cS23 n=1 Tax=Cryptomeria japonica TaxID=3369 RepID=UPI0025AC6A2B|nr:small ribosomal subunit protein cS23 [Cryptomeria japonica]